VGVSFSEKISPFFGRVALVWFFLTVIGDVLNNFHGISVQLGAKHVPVPPLILVIALVLLVIGSFSLLFGYHAKHGAVLLFGLTMVAAVVLHDFWHIPEGADRSAEFDIFARDMAVCGGLLLMVGLGAGPFSIDNRPKGGGGKKH
jgi:putative oxidoreductase